MTMDDRTSSRWIGPFLSAALLLGACSADSADPGAASSDEPAAMALTDETAAVETATDPGDAVASDAVAGDAVASDAEADDVATEEDDPAIDDGPMGFEVEPIDDVEGLSGLELTPEAFDRMRSDEQLRSAVLSEMEAQGLAADEAVCFLDSVSPELFITFGGGGTPDDDQFAELMELLVLCDVSFVTGS